MRSRIVTTQPALRPATVTGIRLSDEQVLVGDGHQVGALDLAGDDPAQPPRRQDLLDALAQPGRLQAEQPPRLVVEHVDGPLGVDRQDPLADAVEHRLTLLHQRRDLRGLDAERHALDGPREQQGGRHAEGEGDRGVEGDVEHLGVEPDADLRLEDADRHLADRASRGVDDGRPRVGGPAEAALVDPVWTRPSSAATGSSMGLSDQGPRAGGSDGCRRGR